MVYTIYKFIVTLSKHNTLGTHLYLCYALSQERVGVDGQRISKSFLRSQYIPVDRKVFENIEINIKRDTGESVSFEFGKCY